MGLGPAAEAGWVPLPVVTRKPPAQPLLGLVWSGLRGIRGRAVPKLNPALLLSPGAAALPRPTQSRVVH